MRLVLLLALSWAAYVQGYHILCVFPVPSRSHNTLGKGIVDSLLKAGHEVTWATPYPPKEAKKGLNIIDVSATLSIIEGIDMTKNVKLGMAGLALVKSYSRNMSLAALNPQMKETLVKTQFDAVVTEMFFSEVDSGYAAIQQVPWILLSGIILQPNLQSLVDAANSVPTHPMIFTDYAVPMDFWQRIVTTAIYAGMKIGNWLDTVNPAVYESMWSPLAKARGVSLPSYEEALHNISVLLVNSHPSFSGTQSLPPNVVEIAGYHIDENIPALPKDLQAILDSSPQGVVYFSMGSVLKSASFPPRTRADLLRVFGALPYTVLWKFEEKLEGLPGNVHIRDWMPQAAILAHPNVKVFITHGGILSNLEALYHGVPITAILLYGDQPSNANRAVSLKSHPNVKVFITHGGILSNLEALYHGVPLIAIPLYGDQPSNANRAARDGYAVKLEHNFDTMGAQVGVAVKEVMGNDSYSKRVKYLSSLFNNRPVKPSQLVSHYVELAIATKGAYHLRSKALQYPWWQRNMIDIVAFVIAVLATLYLIVKKIIRFILNLFTKKQKTSLEPSSHKGKKKVKKT